VSVFKKCFTLAEVLITVVVIGIISSSVIPIIIQDFKDTQYTVGLKSAYSVISDTLKMIRKDNYELVDLYDWYYLPNLFANYLSVTRKDVATKILVPGTYKRYKGRLYASDPSRCWNGNLALVLASGMYINVCDFGEYDDTFITGYETAGFLVIDINGAKPPNMAGMDLFDFYIVKKNGAYVALPYGMPSLDTDDFQYKCIKNAADWTNSRGCTAKRLRDPEHMP
jgi:type II secretory pathway pseudopilin PulG